ncbi:hypothetical protein A3I51_01165 [Candidatus Gottesmanbacteria bacterium RIFCSPLOWO2_02_FULL_38_8]|uniref:ATP-grasp domain-containing protein n=1 Tax=Candidatus Gottesmanbacteria bacterium RIFCSPLOWO2_02_FULL_38_8 TaxID=1798397 RepID=A0A1F6B547_9BACT|nr:MAG: hypothetical protein A3I51_01165 [Candidatus Gottesmanbacteria bacterium RIFCSPLOWO2_02_FULL_38_8]
MKRILVTGAGGSASHNYIESLRNNHRNEKFFIIGTDVIKYHLELCHVNRSYIIPKVNNPQYLTKLNYIIKKEKIDFLHPQPDPEVIFLTKNKNKIAAKTLLPSYTTLTICQNKMLLHDLLEKNSVDVPEAYHITSHKDLRSALKTLLRKHEKVWLRAIRGAGSRAALPVKSIEHAKMWINYWQVMKGLRIQDFMVSEFLPGKEYAFQSFWINGKLIMSQARERIEYIFGNLTPSGQSSSPSVAVTVHNDKVNELGYSAVKAIDPSATGIFCIDMKTDKKGRVVIIEINAGRFFTTSFFFSSAGLNMPYYYTKLGMGNKINYNLKKFNNIPAGWYWVRMIDMGYKLIKGERWQSMKI